MPSSCVLMGPHAQLSCQMPPPAALSLAPCEAYRRCCPCELGPVCVSGCPGHSECNSPGRNAASRPLLSFALSGWWGPERKWGVLKKDVHMQGCNRELDAWEWRQGVERVAWRSWRTGTSLPARR